MYERGYRYFLSGMAVGFDLEAAITTLSLRKELSDIKVVAIIPFHGTQLRFSRAQREQFEFVVKEADEVITLASNYSATAYIVRNNFLVDNASAVITFFTGQKGGTDYTIRRAVKGLLEIHNIYNTPQQSLF